MKKKRFQRRRKLQHPSDRTQMALGARITVSQIYSRHYGKRHYLMAKLSWSDGGTPVFINETERSGWAVVGLGMRAAKAERSLAKAQARIRELEAELERRARTDAPWIVRSAGLDFRQLGKAIHQGRVIIYDSHDDDCRRYLAGPRASVPGPCQCEGCA